MFAKNAPMLLEVTNRYTYVYNISIKYDIKVGFICYSPCLQGKAPSKISGILNQREMLNNIMVAQNYIPPLEVINHKRRRM